MQIEMVDIDSLVLDPDNARLHDMKNLGAIDGSLEEFGVVEPIIVRRSNRLIIGGNGRVMSLKQRGVKQVPVNFVDLDPIKAKALALALNRTAELASWSQETLQKTLAELQLADFDIKTIGFEADDFDFLGKDSKAGLTDPDEVPEVEQNKLKVELGDIWKLGNHRLMCGDSTDKATVEKLMNGEKADMVFTDPPYGVSYTKKTKEVFKSKEYTEIINDDKSGVELKDFFYAAFSALVPNMSEECSYYVSSPQGGDSEMMMMRETGMRCRHQIIWVKDAPVFSMGRLDYDYKHEPILYGWMKRHEFKRKGTQDKSVWEFKRTENKLHPTMKPVELIENALLNSSNSGQLVTDIFLGSGSTLIACEKTNRKCYGMELDPHYCSVIIQRWQDFTGEEAVKLDLFARP